MQQELKIIVKADGTATVTRQLDSVNQSINKIETSKNKLAMGGDFMKGMIGGAITAAAAYLSMRTAINLASSAVREYSDGVTAIKEVNATLNSTGRAAEFNSTELGNMADALQRVSNFGDEEILKGATVSLLRFDSISKEMFPRVQQLAVDMAGSMGGLEGAVRNLGVALSDPVLGMTRLRRAGVMFTESQQETIKALVETGDKAGAQALLLDALESKYGGLALAGVTASAQLKNAWGEYLQAIGGSASVLEGVKMGMATFFYGIAADSKNMTQQQLTDVLSVQQQWGDTTAFIMNLVPTVFKVIGTGLATLSLTVYNYGKFIKDTFAAMINGIKTLWLDLSIFMQKNNPFALISQGLEAITNKLGLSVDFTKVNDKIVSQLETMKANISKGTDFKDVWADVNDMTFTITEGINRITAAVDKAGQGYSSATNSLQGFYDAQRKMVKEGKNPFAGGADLTAADDAGAINAKIDANQAKAVERLRDMQGEMLSAWAAYYTTLDQYSNEAIQAQANQYKHQLEQQYGTILSMQQIDEMYNAKLWELRDAQLAHFKEVNAQLPEIAKTDWEKMTEYAVNAANEMQNSGLNLLENSIYDLISGTNSLKNVWANAWAAMEQIALRAMAEIITKMLTTISLQKLLGLGFGVLGIGSAVIGAPGAADIPSMPIASITPSMPSIPTGGNTNFELITAINGLRSDLAANQNPTFNLTMDGVPLRNALKRVETRLNYMGSGA